jgi:sorting nexin-25
MPVLQLSQSQLLVYGSIGAILSLNIIVKYLPLLRFFVWTFFTGSFVGTVIFLWLLLTTKRNFRPARVCSDDDKWRLKVQDPTTFIRLRNALIDQDDIIRKPAYPPSLIISDEIDDLLRLIIREYVQSWSQHITTNPAFSGHIETAIRHALETIRLRLGELDLIEVVIDRVVPLITSHLADFTTAERIVRGKNLNKNLTESEELDLAIARKYRDGKLHPAANLGFDDTTLAQKDHLRSIVEKILPVLLPRQEIRSRVVSSLVTEVVACAVLFPVVKMLADPDTWNQVVSAFVSLHWTWLCIT